MSDEIDFSGQSDEDLVAIIRHIGDEVARYKRMENEAKREAARRFKASKDVGRFQVQVKRVTRFNAELAKKNLPAALYKKICTLEPNTKLAQVHLTEEQYAQCQKAFDNSITVTFKED